MQKNGLIIFVKNPVLGKVKTRLAIAVGDQKALEIYEQLLSHTQKITENLSAEKWIFYDSFIDENDIWSNEVYQKSLQLPMVDLGQRMANAFWDMIQEGYEKILIIGSDCLELNQSILENAYTQLTDNQRIVIGPANDGGYYLIGFNLENFDEVDIIELLDSLFLDKDWSHNKVFQEAIDVLNELDFEYSLLPKLNDIDEQKDISNLLNS